MELWRNLKSSAASFHEKVRIVFFMDWNLVYFHFFLFTWGILFHSLPFFFFASKQFKFNDLWEIFTRIVCQSIFDSKRWWFLYTRNISFLIMIIRGHFVQSFYRQFIRTILYSTLSPLMDLIYDLYSTNIMSYLFPHVFFSLIVLVLCMQLR